MSGSLRILYIYSSHKYGGMLSNLSNLINNLSEEFIPIVLSLEKDNPCARTINNPRAIFIELNIKGRLDLSAPTKILKIANEQKVDLISAHGHKADFYALLLKPFCSAPQLSMLHGWVSKNFTMRCYHLLDKILICFFDKIIAVSPAQFKRHPFLRLLSSKIEIIPNALDPQSFLKKSFIKKVYSDNSFKIISCSRLSAEKNIATLLKACQQLKANYQLIILGDGPEEKALQDLADKLKISNRCIFAGYQEDIRPWLAGADLLVTCSVIEGLPNTLLEAAALNIAVLASDIAEHRYLLTDSQLFKTKDYQNLALKINHLIDNPDERRQLANQWKAAAAQRFNLAERITKIQNVYLKMKC